MIPHGAEADCGLATLAEGLTEADIGGQEVGFGRHCRAAIGVAVDGLRGEMSRRRVVWVQVVGSPRNLTCDAVNTRIHARNLDRQCRYRCYQHQNLPNTDDAEENGSTDACVWLSHRRNAAACNPARKLHAILRNSLERN